MKIGLYGGTFDPIHLGHIYAAEQVKLKCELEQVFLVPAACPPHKLDKKITPFNFRYRWVEQSIKDKEGLIASDIEQKYSFSYTIDMINHMCKQNKTHEYHLIMGNDMAAIFSTWKDYEKILEICRPIIMIRKDFEIVIDPELDDKHKAILESGIIEIDTLHISSTVIRESIRTDTDISPWVSSNILTEVKNYYNS